MIGLFPTPYPDELLYSIFARYRHLMGYVRDMYVWEDFLGKPRVKLSVLFYPDISLFTETIPKEWGININEIIVDHTCAPYFSSFHSGTEVMKAFPQNGNYWRRLKNPMFCENARKRKGLAYCNYCVKDDIHKYGEPYWHRTHQLPGVYICTEHKVFINTICLPIERGRSSFILPPVFLGEAAFSQVSSNSNEHKFFSMLASDSKRLLDPDTVLLINKVYIRLRVLFSELGFCKNENWSYLKIKNLIEDTYESDLLNVLGFTTLHFKGYSWLIGLERHILISRPLSVLLLIYAMGVSLEDFVSEKFMRRNRSVGARDCLPISNILGVAVTEPISLVEEIICRE